MYSLHLTHPKWTHTRSSGQPCYSARGAVGGSVPCSRTPQSWYWRRILPPPTIPAGPEIRTHNLPLTSPTRYPLGHDCPYCAVCVSSATAFCLFPRCETPPPPSGPLGPVLHTFPFHYHLPSRKPKPQGRCTLPSTRSRSTLRTRTDSPSSPHCQPYPMGTHQTHLWHHPHRASSAGRPRR